jgi:hypothetical protein
MFLFSWTPRHHDAFKLLTTWRTPYFGDTSLEMQIISILSFHGLTTTERFCTG